MAVAGAVFMGVTEGDVFAVVMFSAMAGLFACAAWLVPGE